MNTPELAALDAGYEEVLGGFLRGDQAAITFVRQAFQIAHVLDDLIDRDRQPTDDEVTAAFWLALVELPQNPFMQRHSAMLQPLFATALLNWMTANRLEQAADEEALRIAYIVRSSYVDLLSMAALLVGGLAWAAETGPAIRRWVHAEGFAAYLENLAAEKEARGVR